MALPINAFKSEERSEINGLINELKLNISIKKVIRDL